MEITTNSSVNNNNNNNNIKKTKFKFFKQMAIYIETQVAGKMWRDIKNI
jgi:hypothetical protein